METMITPPAAEKFDNAAIQTPDDVQQTAVDTTQTVQQQTEPKRLKPGELPPPVFIPESVKASVEAFERRQKEHPNNLTTRLLEALGPTPKTEEEKQQQGLADMRKFTNEFLIPEIRNGTSSFLDPPQSTNAPNPNQAKATMPQPPADPLQYPLVLRCQEAFKSLADPAVSDDDKCSIMQECLGAILVEHQLETVICGSLCKALHEFAPEIYGLYVQDFARRGVQFQYSCAPMPARDLVNMITVQRPHLIEELGLTRVSDINMLDAGLAAHREYLLAIREIQLSDALVEERHADLAARHAKTLATAEKLLKRYLETLALLTGRHEQQTRILHVHTQGNVAVQVNQGVVPPRPEV
jgi:hypothetical protein